MVREPKNEVTDPDLFASGHMARGKIHGSLGDRERLDPSESTSSCVGEEDLILQGFRKQNDPGSFFVFGRVRVTAPTVD